MARNKDVVRRYLASLGNLDYPAVASLLTDDVEWEEWADGNPASPVRIQGKEAFIKNIEAPRKFEIRPLRMTEENNVVVAECVVRVPKEDGGVFVGRACSVYELENGKLKRTSSFVAEDRNPA